MDVGGWLRRLGLERYEAAFREHEVNEQVLLSLTQEDLKEIGVGPVGHRRMLLEAIAALRADKSRNDPSAEIAATSSAPSAPSEDRAERRQVTVMFSDLVGSTALSARLDPEDLREVISAYQKAVAQTVGRIGGFVAKYMGDGVLVYFGYPQAHEDDAERAVRAGLEILGALRGLNDALEPEHGMRLAARVGIHTGPVVIGAMGGGAKSEVLALGDTTNIAARLEAVAAPDSVVISGATQRLVPGMFLLHDLGTPPLKGVATPIHAHAVVQATGVRSRLDVDPSMLTPLVGRDQELGLLIARWEQAREGAGKARPRPLLSAVKGDEEPPEIGFARQGPLA